MNAPRRWRQGGLLGALAGTLVLSVVSGKQVGPAEPAAQPVRKAPPPMRAAPAPLPKLELELPKGDAPAEADAAAGKAFGTMSWHVPPPPPPPAPVVKPPPPPPPSAPPVPFSFLGRYGAVEHRQDE